MARHLRAPGVGAIAGTLGRLVLAGIIVVTSLLLAGIIIARAVPVHRDFALGLFAGAAWASALVGVLCAGSATLPACVGLPLGVVILTARVLLGFRAETSADVLLASVLTLVGTYLVGASLSRLTPSGLWGLRASALGGAFQFVYYRSGLGPGAARRLALVPVVTTEVEREWGMTRYGLLAYGAQALDLIFLAAIVTMMQDGSLKRRATLAAAIAAVLAATVLTGATGAPTPALPWLAAFLYLFQAAEYDQLPLPAEPAPAKGAAGPDTPA